MNCENLKENIESLDKVIKNLEVFVFEQEELIKEIKIKIETAEKDADVLDDLKEDYKQVWKEQEGSVYEDLTGRNNND